MFRSLHMKLMLILLLLITSLMAVVGAFLTTSVSSFYINTFYQQMADVFGEEHRDFVSDLRAEAAQEDGAEQLQELMKAYAGELGIDYRSRNYFILDGHTGEFLIGSAGAERELKRPGDFEKFMGSEVEVKLYQPYEGKQSLVGKLEAYENGDITISSVQLRKSQIAQVKLHISI